MDTMHCTSKKLQIIKHITGATYQLFLILSATFAGTSANGKTSYWLVVITGTISIVLQRISSQIDYWQSKTIVREELKNLQITNNEDTKKVKESHNVTT